MRRTGNQLIGRCTLAVGLSLLLAAPGLAATLHPSNEGYDLMRQITTQFVRPNILIVLDVSGSMCLDYLGNELNVFDPITARDMNRDHLERGGQHRERAQDRLGPRRGRCPAWSRRRRRRSHLRRRRRRRPTETPVPATPTNTPRNTRTPTPTETTDRRRRTAPDQDPHGPTRTPTRTPTVPTPTRTPTVRTPTPTPTHADEHADTHLHGWAPTRTPTRTATSGPPTATRTRDADTHGRADADADAHQHGARRRPPRPPRPRPRRSPAPATSPSRRGCCWPRSGPSRRAA